MPLRSAELPGYEFETSSSFNRWRERGWIRALPDHRGREVRGSGHYLMWPDWTRRMVALLWLPGLTDTNQSVAGQPTRLRQMRHRTHGTADALAEWPDVPWLVWIEDQDRMAPAWTAADAVEIALAQPGPLRTIVSPPA